MKPYIESAAAAELEWVKSSYSGNNGNCIEVAVLIDGGRAVRDSKNPAGPALVVSADAWTMFVTATVLGEFPGT